LQLFDCSACTAVMLQKLNSTMMAVAMARMTTSF
jgi:hypothetical protein